MAGIIRFNNSEKFCEATTLKGTRCRHFKRDGHKYCYAHRMYQPTEKYSKNRKDKARQSHDR